MDAQKTTIQIDEELRKELKILASRKDRTYETLLKDMVEVFKELDSDQTAITIPTKLVNQLKNATNFEGFKNISEFVTYILRDLLGEQKKGEKHPEKKLKEKLEALGYL